MKTFVVVVLAASGLFGGTARAEYMEIAATQIVTVAEGEDANPNILVQWELPKELEGLIIDAAVITMTIPVSGEGPLDVDIHGVLKAWDANQVEGSKEWLKGEQCYDDEVVSPAIITAENDSRVTVDVYVQVLNQVASNVENFGFIVIPKLDGETQIEAIAANEAATLDQAKLIIAYRTQR